MSEHASEKNTKYRRKTAEGSNTIMEPRPHFLILNVTERCNSRCAYCYIWKSDNKNVQVPALEYERLFKEARSLGAWQVVLSGGEPLLRLDLEQIVNAAASEGLLVVVVTNGLNLTERRLQSLIDAGLGVITLSLDALDPETYAQHRGVPLERPLRALQLLERFVAKNAIIATINCVLSARNHRQIPEVVARATENGMSVQIQACHTYGLLELSDLIATPETLEDLQDSVQTLIAMKQDGHHISSSTKYLEYIPEFLTTNCIPPNYQCNYGDVAITVDLHLNLLPCWFLSPIGNLSQDTLESLWFRETFAVQRETMKRGECPGCWLICSADWEISCPEPIWEELDG